MDRTERFYKIDQLLNERRVVSIEVFLELLGVSKATFKRDLEYLRDRLNAPIVWDPADRGDILKHGSEVEVLAPPELREVVAGVLAAALGQYREMQD